MTCTSLQCTTTCVLQWSFASCSWKNELVPTLWVHSLVVGSLTWPPWVKGFQATYLFFCVPGESSTKRSCTSSMLVSVVKEYDCVVDYPPLVKQEPSFTSLLRIPARAILHMYIVQVLHPNRQVPSSLLLTFRK